MEFFEVMAPFFKNTETPFALLFIALFFYHIKTAKDREQRHHDLMQNELHKLSEELKILIQVWKILLEKGVTENKNGNDNNSKH